MFLYCPVPLETTGGKMLDLSDDGSLALLLYVDCNGLGHPIDLEFGNVYWIRGVQSNLLSIVSLRKRNMYTGPRGNELTVQRFADQVHGRHGAFDQK